MNGNSTQLKFWTFDRIEKIVEIQSETFQKSRESVEQAWKMEGELDNNTSKVTNLMSMKEQLELISWYGNALYMYFVHCSWFGCQRDAHAIMD